MIFSGFRMIPDPEAQEDERAFWQAVAVGCDRAPLRFAAFAADRLIAALAPAAGEKLLDVACGSGHVALAAAQALGPAGRVTAIDTAEPLLERLEAKRRQFGIANLDLHVMDGAHLEFRRDYFRYLTCSLGLFRFEDPRAALRAWWRVLRTGGEIMVSSFAAGSFEPLLSVLRARLAAAGIPPRQLTLPWEPWCQPEALAALVDAAGFRDVAVEPVTLGYHLKDAHEWWEVVQYSGLRRLLGPLAPAQRAALEADPPVALAGLGGADGLWMDVNVHLVRARKPGA